MPRIDPDATEKARQKVGLPIRPFLYTLDQIGTILNVTVPNLRQSGYLYFDGRQPGRALPDELRCVNIAHPQTDKPDWRVEERELIRWMKRKGFKYVDR